VGDVADVQADVAAGDDQHSGAGVGLEVGCDQAPGQGPVVAGRGHAFSGPTKATPTGPAGGGVRGF
jgi:hypothetical protein